MTTVIISEKPSHAEDLAKVLGIKSKNRGYYECTNGFKVTHARGHMLSLAKPEEYNPAWKRWSWEHLPMVVTDFKYTVNEDTKAQLQIIKELLKTATCVILATDAGREGELIGRLILRYCRYKGPLKRFWTSALTPKDIKNAFNNLLPGSAKDPLYEAALARSTSDWHMGLVGTRAVSLAANVPQQWFPVGRVQTPTLAIVVRNKRARLGFKPETYYEIEAEVSTVKGDKFKMRHAPSEANRVKTLEGINALIKRAEQYFGPCKVDISAEKEAPDLPLSLPALQKLANKALGLSAKETLKTAQELYDMKVTSYPRTDCRYLGENQKDEVPAVLDVVAKTFPSAVKALNSAGVTLRKSLFDDAKLVDHHAIVPTSLYLELSGVQLGVYKLICQSYMRAIAPDHLFNLTKISLDANGVLFKTSGRVVTQEGWKSIKLVEDKSEDAASEE